MVFSPPSLLEFLEEGIKDKLIGEGGRRDF